MRFSPLLFSLCYGSIWTLALPLVFLSRRLRYGWRQRVGLDIPEGSFDIWIQAASGGEAYLAVEIIKGLAPEQKRTVLVTTTTQQGVEILRTALLGTGITPEPEIRIVPLDHPLIVKRFLRRMTAGLLVLLETEIWPSLLMESHRTKCPVLLANGRLSTPSLAGYLPFRSLIAPMAPDRVLAISPKDQQRFDTVFGSATTSVMPNIKFDRILGEEPLSYVANPLSHFFKPGNRLTVLGSVREEEEPAIRQVIERLMREHPKSMIALVPRHMHRVEAWKDFLEKSGISWQLRSELEHHVKPGTLVLWDVFGELSAVYGLAKTVFVGGSLAPLGGQNFLEPLAQGVCPVIGPSWKNFHWVGDEIIDKGLVRMVHSPDELATVLSSPPKKSRERVLALTAAYLNSRKGGTKQVCRTIEGMLEG